MHATRIAAPALLAALLAPTPGAVAGHAVAQNAAKPNILLIVADDLNHWMGEHAAGEAIPLRRSRRVTATALQRQITDRHPGPIFQLHGRPDDGIVVVSDDARGVPERS